MKIIRPITITDSMLTASNVPETDYVEYAAGSTYSIGNRVIVTAVGIHKIYESLKNANTGHYPPDNLAGDDPWWIEVSSTNCWKVFDQAVGSQTAQGDSVTYRLTPCQIFDSIALLNVDAVSANVVSTDNGSNLIANGTAWTGAGGSTPPDGWTKIGSPSFLIDSGSVKITAAGAGDGISQTLSVVPGRKMNLLGFYRSTAGDMAQYAIRDMTHGIDISAATDLASASDSERTFSQVFTVPDNCTLVKVSLLAKSAEDSVWFKTISVATVIYETNIDFLTTMVTGAEEVYDWYSYFFSSYFRITDAVRFEIPPFLNAIVDITINYTGGTVKVGGIVLGLQTKIGTTRYSPQIGIHDYSTKEADTYGVWRFVERDYSKRLACDVTIRKQAVDNVQSLLAYYRATPIVWVASEDYSSMIINGIFKDFNIVISYPTYSICSIEIISLT